MLKVSHEYCSCLSSEIRAALCEIIDEAFDTVSGAEPVVDSYRASVEQIALVWSGSRLVGFQYFQTFDMHGVRVCHLSLAGRRQSAGVSGMQRAIGTSLVLRQVGLWRLFRPFAFAGVYNHPRTYCNLQALGGRVLPNVLRPAAMNDRDRRLYLGVSRQLGIAGNMDPETGLITGRAESVGVRIRPSEDDGRVGSVHEAFMRYISHDCNTGVFVLAVSSIARTVPHFVLQRFRRRKLKATSGEKLSGACE